MDEYAMAYYLELWQDSKLVRDLMLFNKMDQTNVYIN